VCVVFIISIIIIILFHGLGRLNYFGIDALLSFPGASTIFSSSRFVVEVVFRKSGAVHSFEMEDPVLFVFGFHISVILIQPNLRNKNKLHVGQKATEAVILAKINH
jgi:hypothetical protein